MQLLEDRIRREGRLLPGGVVKVDGFLNHRADTALLRALADEFARRLDVSSATLVLTAEASGIALAAVCAASWGLPLLFAKKAKSANLGGGVYRGEAFSYTYQKPVTYVVSREWLSAADRVLIIDDFMASGSAMDALLALVRAAGAALAGVGVAVEKGFQGGGDRLRAAGLPYTALAVIDAVEDGRFTFRTQPRGDSL